jgi:hypothetical protein
MTPKSRGRKHQNRRRQHPPAAEWDIGIWDVHLPVLSVEVHSDGSVRTRKPIVYGTAFPIAPGLFVTAGHVLRDANSDGEPVLSVVVPGEPMRPFRVGMYEVFESIDLGLLVCEQLRHLPPLTPDFDRPLRLLAQVSAVGFPLAMDAEYVSLTPRAFGGFVVARRDLRLLPAQPTGYEVSFFAPQGLSGAPLISTAHGKPRCYGYMVQQATLGLGTDVTPVGIAVGIEALWTVRFDSRPLAWDCGRPPVAPRPPTPPALPGGLPVATAADLEGWPDDDQPA